MYVYDYDINGKRVTTPVKGIYIKKCSDGSVIANKITEIYLVAINKISIFAVKTDMLNYYNKKRLWI